MMTACDSTLSPKSVSETDTDAFSVPMGKKIKVVVARNESDGDTSERRQSDAQERHEIMGTSGREIDTQLPDIVDRMDEINDKDVRLLEKDTDTRYPAPEGDPYDRSMRYLHKHSLPSLFQYITINLAYQRPEDAIDFMIDEVTKRSQGQHEEMKWFG